MLVFVANLSTQNYQLCNNECVVFACVLAIFPNHTMVIIITVVTGQIILLNAINIALVNIKLATFDYLQHIITIT